MTPLPRRLVLAGCVALVAVSAVTACSQSGADSGDPAAVEADFLDALSNGDGLAALALTTTARADLDCPDIVSDYGTLSGGIGGAVVGETTIDGDTATVEFTYSVLTALAQPVEVSAAHTLVRADGGWRIELPEEYRISATLPADVVAEASLDGTAAAAGACAVTVADGAIDIVALPGSYDLDVRDPTGVFGSAAFTSADILVSDEAHDPVAVDYIDAATREQAATNIRNALIPLVEECVAGNFVSSSCPEGLPVPDGSVTLAPRPSDRFSDFPTVTTISSDDGQTWRFAAGGQTFSFLRAGAPETFPMEYSGAVKLSATGTLELVLD